MSSAGVLLVTEAVRVSGLDAGCPKPLTRWCKPTVDSADQRKSRSGMALAMARIPASLGCRWSPLS